MLANIHWLFGGYKRYECEYLKDLECCRIVGEQFISVCLKYYDESACNSGTVWEEIATHVKSYTSIDMDQVLILHLRYFSHIDPLSVWEYFFSKKPWNFDSVANLEVQKNIL
jgi:hypothetical protein